MGFWARILINAFALWAATQLVPGIHVAGFFTLLFAALVMGIVNAIVKPPAFILSLPLTLLSFGLFLLVLNAAMLGLTALLMPGLTIDGFGPAVLGAIVISIVSWVARKAFAPPGAA